MSNRDVAVAQPGGASTVPPATPVRSWLPIDTKEAPPPTVTRAGTPPGRLIRNWLTPPASRKGNVPDGRGRLTSRMSEPAVTAIPPTRPPRRSASVRWVPAAKSRLHTTDELSTTVTASPLLPEVVPALASDSTIGADPDSTGRIGAPSGVEARSRAP